MTLFPRAMPKQRQAMNRPRVTWALLDFNADTVVHFAAATAVRDSFSGPDTCYCADLQGTRSLLNAMRRAGTQQMLFSSIFAAYGMVERTTPSGSNPHPA